MFRVFRQALAWGVARGLVTRDASVGIRNPKRKRHERRDVLPFESWAEVEAVADELDPRFRAIPFLAVGCGLRPEELFGLHRADVDRERGSCGRAALHGRDAEDGGKTDGSVRAVPLRQVVLDALDAMPPRIDTPILVPGAPAAATSTSNGSATATGHRRYAPPGSSTAGSTTAGTRSRRGRSRAACSSGTSRRSWARRSRRSRTRTRGG